MRECKIGKPLVKIIYPIFLLLLSNLAFGCEYLYGTWRSSMEDSFEFASGNSKVTAKQLDFVKQAFGHLRISFSKEFMVTHESGEIDVIIDEKNYPFKFDYLKSNVIFKSCESNKIELEYKNIDGVLERYTITPVTENRLWIQLESDIEREYFRRMK